MKKTEKTKLNSQLIRQKLRVFYLFSTLVLISVCVLQSCRPKSSTSAFTTDAASKVYVAPGSHDEFYNFVSGGFSGQLAIYGIPSGRLFKVIPVFSANPENGYGYSEETKAMLNTSHGWIPWGDSHHTDISRTNNMYDGRWLFINENNTPRVARVNLETFKTVEIIELPNSGGNHSSPFATANTEYVVAGTRFSVPGDYDKTDIPINSFVENFKGHVSFIKVDPKTGGLSLAFQVSTPGVSFDLSRSGHGPSHGWSFFSCYNTEQAHTNLEVNSAQKDKDFILAINWKKAEELIAAGGGKKQPASYFHNVFDESTHTATSKELKEVLVLDAKDYPELCYFIPCPKSPHGCDVDPSGEFFMGSGKLAALVPVFSFAKMIKAIENKEFEGNFGGINVIKYESALHGELTNPGLGPLHTEFDDKGNAYTSFFLSSEVVKWDVKSLTILDRVPTYYSVGHICVMGGNTDKPYGKYLVAYNKITKDRYLPTGPELCQSAQLFDISGDKMKLLLDFPTIGEPHYASGVIAPMIKDKQIQFYKLEDNKHPYVTKKESDVKIERKGNDVHVYITSIRSRIVPDNIEGIKVGDVVYFHMTNIEQEWDIPHGFAVKGNTNAELLVMPGETATLKWVPTKEGIFPFYCTDFCSAMHQEMQGYARVSPAGSDIKLSISFDDKKLN
jgi:nitrous-oxide reductase